MKNNKLDIFEKNAEFFERFNNSLDDTTKDRYERTRFTVTGLENKVEFAVTNAQGRIKKAEDDAIANIVDTTQSVGTGKYLREGAYGWGGTAMPLTRIGDPINRNGFYRMFADFGHFHYGSALNMQYNAASSTLFGVKSVTSNTPEFIAVHDNSNGDPAVVRFMTSGNTYPDSNGVLHNSSNSIDALNTSDMADTVVDNDLITVTSGAVYRAIQELKAEIALLKGKSYE